jgi:transposase
MRGVIYTGFKPAISVRRVSVQWTGIVQNTDRCPYSAGLLFRIQTVVRTMHGYHSEYRPVSVQWTGIVQKTDRCPYSAGVLFRIQTVVRTMHGYHSEYRPVSVQWTGIVQNTDRCPHSARVLFRIQSTGWLLGIFCFRKMQRPLRRSEKPQLL